MSNHDEHVQIIRPDQSINSRGGVAVFTLDSETEPESTREKAEDEGSEEGQFWLAKIEDNPERL